MWSGEEGRARRRPPFPGGSVDPVGGRRRAGLDLVARGDVERARRGAAAQVADCAVRDHEQVRARRPPGRVEAGGGAPQADELSGTSSSAMPSSFRSRRPRAESGGLVATIEVDERLAVVPSATRASRRASSASAPPPGGRPARVASCDAGPRPALLPRPSEASAPSAGVRRRAPSGSGRAGAHGGGLSAGRADGDVDHRPLAADRPERGGAAVEEADLKVEGVGPPTVRAAKASIRTVEPLRTRWRCRSRRRGRRRPSACRSARRGWRWLATGSRPGRRPRRMSYQGWCRCQGPRRWLRVGGAGHAEEASRAAGPGDVRVVRGAWLSASTLSRRFWGVADDPETVNGVEVDAEGRPRRGTLTRDLRVARAPLPIVTRPCRR